MRAASRRLIEDNAPNRALLTAFLAARANVTFLSADCGLAGVELAQQRPPDIVLLDIQLPDIDGYEVLRRLRGDRRLASVPVIAVSADAMPHDVQRGREAGFDRYLSKPLDLDELAAAIEQLRLRGAIA